MKFNVDIELDWIEEDTSISAEIKNQIIFSIQEKVGKKIEEQAEEKVNAMIDNEVVNKVNSLTEKLFNDFLDREINISDNYGSTIKSYPKLEDLIKEKFDNFMIQSVDKDGKSYDGSYGKKYSRINFIVEEQLKTFANEFTTEAVKKVSEEIKEHVKEGLTTKLGAELMNVLKVNDMLKIN